MKLGSREFLVTLSLNHPLSSVKFFSRMTKLLLNNSQQLSYDAVKEEECSIFEPRLLLIPLKEFVLFL